jgi:hypothetical protein
MGSVWFPVGTDTVVPHNLPCITPAERKAQLQIQLQELGAGIATKH